MSDARPPLKIKFHTAPPRPPSQASETPSSAMPTKLKLKMGGPKPSDNQQPPASSPQPTATKPKAQRKPKVKKEKPARTSNPTPKKRALEESILSDADDDPTAKSPPLPLNKRRLTIKLNTKVPSTASLPSAPLTSNIRQIKFKGIKGKKLKETRQKGVGYDSEAEDQESDPAIEEDFILRMQPGDDCDYLRQAITEQRFGPKSQGGADVRLRFLKQDGRRAMVTIRGTNYAASLVDLPCIVEGMKSWDKRAWYKTVDISQMLLVLGPIKNEEEAMSYPLPKHELDEKTMQYAHGLTPPMRWARKRRFRKRINRAAIEDVEQEVDRLLAEDERAQNSKWTFVDERQLERDRALRMQSAEAQADMDMDNEEDAEGDYDNQPYYEEGVDSQAPVEGESDDEMAAEIEANLMQAEVEAAAAAAQTPVALTDANAPSPISFAAETPMAADSPAVTPSKAATSGDDEEEESSDEDTGSPDEVDEDEVEQQQDLMRQREAIEDLQAAIKSQEAELERQQNLIFKKKLAAKIHSLKAELESKMAAMGDGGEG